MDAPFREVDRSLVLWDVIEEHLDEAAFACRQFEAAFASTSITLADLREGHERQLRAHLAGLLAAGPAVVGRMLEVELGTLEPDAHRLLAVALALLAHGRQELVTCALGSELTEVAVAAQRALELRAGPSFDDWLLRQIAGGQCQLPRAALLRAAASRQLVVDNLLASLQSADCAEVAAAAACAARAPARTHLPVLEWLLEHPSEPVRDAALLSCLAQRSSIGFARCRERAASSEAPSALAMLLLALLADPSDHRLLIQQLAHQSHRHAAVFALGYSGQAALVEPLLDALSSVDLRFAKLAGEALSTLVGVDETQPGFHATVAAAAPDSLPELADDSLDESLEPHPADDLPVLDAEKVAAWWRTRAPEHSRSQRLLRGAAWTLEQAVRFLEQAPLRRRHALGMWLSLRSGARLHLDTRGTSLAQEVQIRSLAGNDAWLDVRFSRW